MNRVRPLSLLSAGILSAFALVTFANSSSGETVSKPEGNSSEASPRPDKVWFVTGSNKGLGLAISTAALQSGYRVVATSREPEQVKAKLSGFGDRVLALRLDVTKQAEIDAAVAEAQAKFGRIDVLVNNAGYGQLGWFENTSDEQIRQQFEVNIFGAMNVTRAVLPIMRHQRSGQIFTISSVAGMIAVAGSAVYSSSKFAVEGWMEGLADEVKPLGITATIIEPGFFRTDFLDPSSVRYPEGNIADYADRAAAFKAWHDKMNHNQIGDPPKLGALLVKIAEMPSPPLRVAAGSDAQENVVKKAERIRSEAERLKPLSISTDGVPSKDAPSFD
jgi:NAD(P)-dependent dehydrogenase (short-subunit alcohol dehydrogenase family)